MAVWPAGLPQIQMIGLGDQQQDERVQTNMDAGPPKIRARFTAPVRVISIPMVMTSTERAVLDAFWTTTLARGTGNFDWEDPVDDSTVVFEFAARPGFTLDVGNSTPGDRIWKTVLSLRTIP